MVKDFLEQRLGIKQFAKAAALFLIPLFIVFWIVDTFVMSPYVHSVGVVKVPNITGLSLSRAGEIIKSSKLRVAEVREVYSESVPKGRIIRQLPFAGSEVREGRRMYITVSRGIEKVTIPYLIGKPERDAWLDILRLGFNVGEITYEEREDKPGGIVLRQYPRYGTKLPYGTTINIVVSSALLETDINIFEGMIRRSEARNRAAQYGLILMISNPELEQTFSNDDPIVKPDYGKSAYKLREGDTIWVEILPEP